MEELRLSPEEARQLNSANATLLLLDVPPLSQLGLDYLTFTTASLFKGIKMIPPGPHLLHYSPPPPSHSLSPSLYTPTPSSPPSYQWLYLHPSQILPLRLHPPPSSHLLPLSPTSTHRYALGVANFDFDRGLGPYPLTRWPRWASLTSHLTEPLLHALEGERRRGDEEWESAWTLGDKAGTGTDDRGKRGRGQTTAERREQRRREEEEGGERGGGGVRRPLRSALSEAYTSIYTAVPPLVMPAGASPSDITALHLDRSHTLTALLSALTSRYSSPSADAVPPFTLLLAELQHCFLSFLIAQHPPAFSHYRHLLHLLCLCSSHLTSHPPHLAALLTTLRPQLEELPEDLLIDDLSRDNLWVEVVEELDEVAEEVGEGVRGEREAVQRVMRDRFGWQGRTRGRVRGVEGDEGGEGDDDEYAPVVVNLDDLPCM